MTILASLDCGLRYECRMMFAGKAEEGQTRMRLDENLKGVFIVRMDGEAFSKAFKMVR